MASGLPVLIVYCTFNDSMAIRAVSALTILKMVYIIAFGTVAAYISWYTGIKKAGPIKVIIFHYIVPVSSMILGAFFLGEYVNAPQIFGGILALGGIIAVRLGSS